MLKYRCRVEGPLGVGVFAVSGFRLISKRIQMDLLVGPENQNTVINCHQSTRDTALERDQVFTFRLIDRFDVERQSWLEVKGLFVHVRLSPRSGPSSCGEKTSASDP